MHMTLTPGDQNSFAPVLLTDLIMGLSLRLLIMLSLIVHGYMLRFFI